MIAVCYCYTQKQSHRPLAPHVCWTNPDFVSAGLDSFTASEVMEVVKGLVSSGMTIAATIHTPTSRTFQLFDRILILQRGRIVYFGDNGEAASNYFSSSPYFKVV